MEKKVLYTEKIRFEILDAVKPINENSIIDIFKANIGKKFSINYINFNAIITCIDCFKSGIYTSNNNYFSFDRLYLPNNFTSTESKINWRLVYIDPKEDIRKYKFIISDNIYFELETEVSYQEIKSYNAYMIINKNKSYIGKYKDIKEATIAIKAIIIDLTKAKTSI